MKRSSVWLPKHRSVNIKYFDIYLHENSSENLCQFVLCSVKLEEHNIFFRGVKLRQESKMVSIRLGF